MHLFTVTLQHYNTRTFFCWLMICNLTQTTRRYHPIARKMIEADMKKDACTDESTVEAGDTVPVPVPVRSTPAKKSDKFTLPVGLILLSVATLAAFMIFAKNKMK